MLPNYSMLGKVARYLHNLEEIDKSSLKKLQNRIRTFLGVRKSGRRCIFSHKVSLWEDHRDPYLARYELPGQYFLSLHMLDWADFWHVLLAEQARIAPGKNGRFARYLWDYRDSTPRKSDNQRSFSGRDRTFSVEAKSITGGHLTRVPICHIVEDRFYPGLHQNLILPQFERIS